MEFLLPFLATLGASIFIIMLKSQFAKKQWHRLKWYIRWICNRVNVESEREQRIRREAEKRADQWIKDGNTSPSFHFYNNGSKYSKREQLMILSVYRNKGFAVSCPQYEFGEATIYYQLSYTHRR